MMTTTIAPTLQSIKAFPIQGFKTRTTNAAEGQPATAKIGPLWGQFFATMGAGKISVAPTDSSFYGVYSQYESDAHGAFDVTAAVASLGQSHGEVINDQLVSFTIACGDYLVFRTNGAMPDAVIQAWQYVWAYFAAPREDFERCFVTDFEQYIGADEVAVHIGVKRLLVKG
jgi:predicted transcriptional regulator YdeE